MKREPLVILNFNDRLDEDLKTEITEALGREVEERRIKIAINSQKFAYTQVLAAMDAVDLLDLPEDVVLNLPRLPIAAVYIVNEFYARTGRFPIILELLRRLRKNPARSFGTLRDLELEVDETRRRRQKLLSEDVRARYAETSSD